MCGGRGRYEVCYCVAGKVRGACVPGCVNVILYVSVGGKCVYIYICVHIWGGGRMRMCGRKAEICVCMNE